VIRHELAVAGTPIGPNDLMIVATVLAHRLILVTNNVKEFSRVVGLDYVDWESQ
jgi:tRNA(fMet)-specific endonuclease VapC